MKTLLLLITLLSGLSDPASGLIGYNFKWGSTGLCPLGDGLYYISHNGKQDGSNYCRATLYEWDGAPGHPFVPVQ